MISKNLKIKDPKWAVKPRDILTKNIHLFKPGSVLDLGGSDGVNALFLAQNNFSVTSVDKDLEANKKLIEFSKNNNTQIDVIHANLDDYSINKSFDNIITFYVLHFLSKDSGLHLIEDMKKNTSKKGINCIIGFTNVGDFKKDERLFYFKNNQLVDIYLKDNWDLLLYKKSVRRTKSRQMQEQVSLIARNR